MNKTPISQLTVCIKGAGEMASGVACRLHSANISNILMLETHHPLAVRRKVSFCEAIHDGLQVVEKITARKISHQDQMHPLWLEKEIPVLVDPEGTALKSFSFDVLIDATLAKKNLGTEIDDASLVIGLGPGFTADRDVHRVIETQRGHNLGRVIDNGKAAPNTGIPGNIGGFTTRRVLRAPAAGCFTPLKSIGDPIAPGDIIATVDNQPVTAEIGGVLRGLIRDGIEVSRGLKLGDVDPRGEVDYCTTVSEKARAVGGAVLEAILARFNE